jgi:S1-C subfamily serine protease
MEANTEPHVERIILKHLTGSKAKTETLEEKIELHQRTEITIGRLPSSVIRFDENHDNLVSGKHAQITYDPTSAGLFTLTDLGSRNGTYVNQQRVNSPVNLLPGDVIELGTGGPKFEFDCEPHPASLIRRTRAATSHFSASRSGAPAFPPTRSAELKVNTAAASASSGSFADSSDSDGASFPPADEPAKVSVGKETVERIVTSKQRETRRQMLLGGGALALVVAAVIWFWPKPIPPKCGEGGVCPPADISKLYGPATVKIAATWKLIAPSGRLVYHQYMLNRDDNGEKLIANAPDSLPAFVRLDNGKIEPYLSYERNQNSVPIGGAHEGSGFVVNSNGFILTNRHVAATWKDDYQYPPNTPPIGLLYASDKRTRLNSMVRNFPRWIPAETGQEFEEFKGANDKLEVAFPGSENRIAADLIRTSESHDVALIKISVPEATPGVRLNDNWESIREGEAITVLGYPAVTKRTFTPVAAKDDPFRETRYKEVPHTTVTPGNIGAILRSGEGKDKSVSLGGDVYQLTVNATGEGNSGGPVFDDKGGVIGIFYAGRRYGNTVVSYAVPIRYGQQLLGSK